MGWAGGRVERKMRKRGVVAPGETVVGAYAAELRSTDGGRTTLPRDGRMTLAGARLPIGRPVQLCFTERTVALGAPRPIAWVTDVAAVAAARNIEGSDILDLLLVDEPPRQYRLRLTTRTAAAEAAQRLSDLSRERLDGLPADKRAYWLVQYADMLHQVGELEPAAELYRRVAETTVQPYASTAAMNYGIHLKMTGSIEKARQYWLRALDSGEDGIAGQSAMLLGVDAAKRGNGAAARDYFSRAGALGDPWAAGALARMDRAELDR